MTLPLYDSKIGLEEALNQFDWATGRLVLFPRGRQKIREHVFDAATDAALASNRCVGVFERDYKVGKIGFEFTQRFLRDVDNSMKVLEKLDEVYDLFETVATEVLELDRLRYERSIVQSYISLIGLRAINIRSMINQKISNQDIEIHKP